MQGVSQLQTTSFQGEEGTDTRGGGDWSHTSLPPARPQTDAPAPIKTLCAGAGVSVQSRGQALPGGKPGVGADAPGTLVSSSVKWDPNNLTSQH